MKISASFTDEEMQSAMKFRRFLRVLFPEVTGGEIKHKDKPFKHMYFGVKMPKSCEKHADMR